MNIGIVGHVFDANDGTGGYTHELLARVAPGNEVTLYVTAARSPLPAGVRLVTVPAITSRTYPMFLTFPRAFARVRGRHDLVHAQGWVTSSAEVVTAHIVLRAWRAAGKRAGVKPGLGERLLGWWVERREAELYRSARIAIAPSRKVAGELARACGRTGETAVIPHGFRPPRPGPPRAEARAALRLPEGFVALYVGDPRKGLETALRALARAKDARLAVVSRAPAAPWLERARALGVLDRATWIGPLADPTVAYVACDALIHASIYDSFGLVVAEAMSHGLPAIVSRDAGISEIVEHDRSAWVLGDDVVSGAAEALSALAADPERRKRLGEGARAVAAKRTWEDVARETLAIYERARA